MAVSEPEVTAESLAMAYHSGHQARFSGRPRRPDGEDADEAYAWLMGWAAADEEIYALWRG